MPISNSKTLKTSVLSIGALAAGSAWGKTGGLGGGSDPRLGVDFLALDTLPIQNATVCLPAASQDAQFSGLQPNTQSIVVDASKFRTVKASFVVSELEATDEDRILLLAYSPTTSPSPPIITTDKGPELGLKLAETEVLGVYYIPALFEERQAPTKVGQAISSPTSKMTVHVNFDVDEINDMIRRNKGTIYIQAAMLRISEYNEGLLENMILSEMDELKFVPNKCPDDTVESYEADESGRLGKSSP